MLPFHKKNCALVVAHPGHELRLYGWLTLALPTVFVLTDGSGHSSDSRLHQTTAILRNTGARIGSIYGRVTDREFYQAILHSKLSFFLDITNELANALVTQKIEFVVGDAIEGYNPVHDVCRLMINGAVRLARAKKHLIENYDVLLMDGMTNHPGAEALTINLSSQVLSQKMNAARNYSQISSDFAAIIEKEGTASLIAEHLRPVIDYSGAYEFVDAPFYEQHGEKQVAAGHYEHVLRYGEHMLPLAKALQQLH
jgi:hypothetical protein